MNKHTPAPWKVEKFNNGKKTIIMSQYDHIAEVFKTGTSGHAANGYNVEKQESNARLIAASPLMYEYITRKAKEGDKEAQEIIKTLD